MCRQRARCTLIYFSSITRIKLIKDVHNCTRLSKCTHTLLLTLTHGTARVFLKGGTVDITAHEVQENGSLRSLLQPTGGHWGGTLVSGRFESFLEKIFTTEVLSRFKTEYKAEYLELKMLIEYKKRVQITTSDEVTIRLPVELYNLFTKMAGTTMKDLLLDTDFGGVKMKRGGLKIKKEILIGLFDESKDAIIDKVKELLQVPAMENVQTILMIGGFSESPVMQDAIRTAFKDFHIIFPEDAGNAVMKGK